MLGSGKLDPRGNYGLRPLILSRLACSQQWDVYEYARMTMMTINQVNVYILHLVSIYSHVLLKLTQSYITRFLLVVAIIWSANDKWKM